jgi:hypothetical protein
MILSHHTYLEMDTQASEARKSLILGQDFWHEKAEEDLRQRQCANLRRMFQYTTQREKINFTKYFYGFGATA